MHIFFFLLPTSHDPLLLLPQQCRNFYLPYHLVLETQSDTDFSLLILGRHSDIETVVVGESDMAGPESPETTRGGSQPLPAGTIAKLVGFLQPCNRYAKGNGTDSSRRATSSMAPFTTSFTTSSPKSTAMRRLLGCGRPSSSPDRRLRKRWLEFAKVKEGTR